ncbi:MAG: ExeM/NucH family extracellular endonuclease [Motilibacteraceae bacterium]
MRSQPTGRTRAVLAAATTLAVAGALAPALAAAPGAAATGGLFFSEYVEGTSNNKALEIYNPGSTPVDLGASGYAVKMFFNGASTAGLTVGLTGTVAPGDVFVLAQAKADPAVLAQADQTDGSGWFNGDDAVELVRGVDVVDSIGQLGVDPGTQWGSGGTGTADRTLRRKGTVTTGDADPTDTFDPAAQWDGYPVNTFDGLGSYSSSGTGGGTGGGTGSGGTALCDITNTTSVPQIQGAGDATPFAGQEVTTRGVVTEVADGLSGFYLQDPTGDGDPATSDGVFVYLPSGNPLSSVRVAPGDVVALTAKPKEFSGQTELDSLTALAVCGSAALPEPVQVTLPVPADQTLERYEGMQVRFPQTLTMEQTYFLGRYGQLTLGLGRTYQPTNLYPAGSTAAKNLAEANARRLVVLDDVESRQNPDPVPYLDSEGTGTVRSGDTVRDVAGALDEGPISSSSSVRGYRVQPVTEPSFTASNPRTPAPAPVGGVVKVASANVLNFFTTLGKDDPQARGADTAVEFQRQRTKLVNELLGLDADVVGLMEIENNGAEAVGNLIDALNAAAGTPGRWAYVADPATGVGDDAIKVAQIYRTDHVAPVGPSLSDTSPVWDRRPVAQTYRVLANDETFSVVVNHFKSKGSCPSAAQDPDNADRGDGQGCWNAKRVDQARTLLSFLDTVTQVSGDDDVLVVGDLNSYAQEDPVLALEQGGLQDQVKRFVGDTAYSYVFDGLAGYLDHALASPSLAAQVSGVSEWHNNADEPSVLDYNTEFKSPDQVTGLYTPAPYRASDHDPVLVGLDLGGCRFARDEQAKVETLRGDCSTGRTIEVPEGWTLEGAGHTVRAFDLPGQHFSGAVVSGNGEVHVRDLTVGSLHLSGCEDLRGVLLQDASGSVEDVRVQDLAQSGGCPAAAGVEVRAAAGPVSLRGVVVQGGQRAGVLVTGAGAPVSVLDSTVTGLGATDAVRQDGVVVSDGARAIVQGSELAHLRYSPADDVACGLRFSDAGGVRQDRNHTVDVERPLCNVGRGGGNPGV